MAFENRFYPHLLPVDIPVWKRFLTIFGHKYRSFDYDIRVGKGSTPPPDLPDNIKKMWTELSQKRIDAVGYRTNRIDIIEITRRAGMKAIGQLTTYPVLYQATYKPEMPLRPLLVAEELIADIQPALQTNQISYILLPEHETLTEIFNVD